MKSILARPRLHRSSWVVCAATIAASALIIVPGEIQDGYLAPYPTFSHGWPLEFHKRDVDHVPTFRGEDGRVYKQQASWPLLYPPSRAPWISWESWQLWQASESAWTPWSLLMDGFATLAIVATATALWEWRRRRRSNPLQFRISEVLIIMCLVAILLGGRQYLNRAAADEQALCESIAEFGVYPLDECRAPTWLRRLVGQGYLPRGFFRVSEVDIMPADIADFETLAPLLAQFQYLHTIALDVSDEDVTNALDAMATLKPLRTLDFSGGYASELFLNEKELSTLARLTQLTELRFWAKDQLEPDLLESIRAALPGCRITFGNDGL